MNKSVFSLIQENRRLFYSGIIRNQYKTPVSASLNGHSSISAVNISALNKRNNNFRSRSISMLQDLFNE